MKICPNCGNEHGCQTKLCQKCYTVRWKKTAPEKQCPTCGRMDRVFGLKGQMCSRCYQKARYHARVGCCEGCGKTRKLPFRNRCGYCSQALARLKKPPTPCGQCGRMTKQFAKGVCRSCYTNNTKRRAKYGITAEQYMAMLKTQAGNCGICDKPIERHPHVDHDHASGAIRGLLCVSCNLGLGHFGDDPERLRAAAAYLEFHRSRKVA